MDKGGSANRERSVFLVEKEVNNGRFGVKIGNIMFAYINGLRVSGAI